VKFDKEFLDFCRPHYITIFFDEKEFLDDIAKISMVKKMLSSYKNRGKLNANGILNNIRILRNVFGQRMTNVVLFYKINTELYPQLKACLYKAGVLQADVPFIDNIKMDDELYSLL